MYISDSAKSKIKIQCTGKGTIRVAFLQRKADVDVFDFMRVGQSQFFLKVCGCTF